MTLSLVSLNNKFGSVHAQKTLKPLQQFIDEIFNVPYFQRLQALATKAAPMLGLKPLPLGSDISPGMVINELERIKGVKADGSVYKPLYSPSELKEMPNSKTERDAFLRKKYIERNDLELPPNASWDQIFNALYPHKISTPKAQEEQLLSLIRKYGLPPKVSLTAALALIRDEKLIQKFLEQHKV